MIRKATEKDIKAIAKIYEDIHTEEEKGALCIGWQRGVYPTGYKEIGIVPCVFNGIDGVNLVLLEKKL